MITGFINGYQFLPPLTYTISASSMQTPGGIQDCKSLEIASVDSSEAIWEEAVLCPTPELETLPQVEESLNDVSWTKFKKEVPTESPAQCSPLKGCIPQAFDKDFNTVLYSSCEKYQSWVAEAADIIQNNELLKEKVCPVQYNQTFCLSS